MNKLIYLKGSWKKNIGKMIITVLFLSLLCIFYTQKVYAVETMTTAEPTTTTVQTDSPTFGISIETNGQEGLAGSLQIILVLTILSNSSLRHTVVFFLKGLHTQPFDSNFTSVTVKSCNNRLKNTIS